MAEIPYSTTCTYKIDVALLPINGNDLGRGVSGSLDTREAALLAKEIGARMVIPCHYHMFTLNTADPNDFGQEAEMIESLIVYSNMENISAVLRWRKPALIR